MRDCVAYFFGSFVQHKRCRAIVESCPWRNCSLGIAGLNRGARSVGESLCFARGALNGEAVSVFKRSNPHGGGNCLARLSIRDERNVFGVVDLGVVGLGCHKYLSGRGDLNPRPPGPKPGTLPTAPLPGLG